MGARVPRASTRAMPVLHRQMLSAAWTSHSLVAWNCVQVPGIVLPCIVSTLALLVQLLLREEATPLVHGRPATLCGEMSKPHETPIDFPTIPQNLW